MSPSSFLLPRLAWKKLIARLIFVALPTIAISFYWLQMLNQQVSALQNNWKEQGLYFSIGLVASMVLCAFRFRFLSILALVIAGLYLIYFIVNKTSVGEFDTIYYTNNIQIFSTLFLLGFLVGFGFTMVRFFSIFLAVGIVCVQILLLAQGTTITADSIIRLFIPSLISCFYLILVSNIIHHLSDGDDFIGYFVKRLGGFLLLMGLLVGLLLWRFDVRLKTLEQDWGSGGRKGNSNERSSESMTQNNKDGSLQNKDQMKLTGSLSKDKRLVFVAHLENYFPNTKVNNPLYFTNNYYTKFDTLTQTFETDEHLPSNDLFLPNPSKIPLYFSFEQPAIIENAKATLNRKVLSADVYNVLLSPSTFVAPSTAFFCQPIDVEAEYKKKYKSAYRAKMWVSDLNSAYFIYNPGKDTNLRAFQEMRFKLLRSSNNFSSVDKRFMQYYTFMPSNPAYQKIKELAHQLAEGKTTVVDRVIAIRDFFLQKNEYGEPNFRYSDNPGVPGLPSASKLSYFLFENKKGYCAYYAGSTLFMLRALGIPSRIATGFLTIDRSNKNPGWYWFYADQAHAWVQVFFPGFGWIDFDTTISNEDTRQAEQPDGTPPHEHTASQAGS